MAVTEARKYRAFISYSHKDKDWGEWLHAALEKYRVPSELIGNTGAHGEIPKSLGPVFRDRADLAAGPHYDEKIRSALLNSEHLIVICSPRSAASAEVNEEIRAFKAAGRGDRILALIVDGEPNDPANECFPPALKFTVDPAGLTTDVRDKKPMAADAREKGDGKLLAKLKLVAGLIGVELDEVRRRDEAERQRRTRFYRGLATAMCTLAVIATGSAWWAFRENREKSALLQRTQGLLDKTLFQAVTLADKAAISHEEFGLPVAVTSDFMRDAEGIIEEAEKISGDVHQLGADTLTVRTARGHARILFARNAAKMGRIDEQEQHAGEARKIFEALIAGGHGWLEWEHELSEARVELAHVLLNRKQPDRALQEYEAALEIKKRATAALPADSAHNIPWKRSLALAHAAVGETHNRLGNKSAALAAFKQSLSVIEPLVEPGSDDTETKQTFLHLLMLSGNAMRANGDEDEAKKLVTYGVAVADQVAAQHPTSILLRRRKAALTQVLADILSKKGDYEQAMQNYMSFHDVYRQLSRNDPPNTSYANSLYFGLIKIGETAVLLDDRKRGAEAFEEAIAGYESLIAKQPDNNRWKEILGWAYDGRAEIHRDAGEHDKAVAMRQRQLAMFEAGGDLAGIARVHGDIGDLHSDAGQWQAALQSLNKCLEMRRGLYSKKATESLQRELASVLGRISDVKRRLGQIESALADARGSYEFRSVVLAARPDDPGRRAFVGETLKRLGELTACAGDAEASVRHFEEARIQYSAALAVKSSSKWSKAVDDITAALADPANARAMCQPTAFAD